jgi:hypothetical protein
MTWSVEGRYFETCNCLYLCPCITTSMTAPPDERDCKFALACQIDRGSKDGTSLDGLAFIVVAQSQGAMADGNWTVGLVVDDRADAEQQQAILEIASGQAGGPMANLAPLIAKFAGIERWPIRFEEDGTRYAVTAGELVEESCEAVMASPDAAEPMAIVNTVHPVNSRLGLARATKSRFHAFGIDWDDATATRNAHFAPISWSG